MLEYWKRDLFFNHLNFILFKFICPYLEKIKKLFLEEMRARLKYINYKGRKACIKNNYDLIYDKFIYIKIEKYIFIY